MPNRGHNLTTATWVELPDGSGVALAWEFSSDGELLSCCEDINLERWLRDVLGDRPWGAEVDRAWELANREADGDRADRLYDEMRDRDLEVWREDER